MREEIVQANIAKRRSTRADRFKRDASYRAKVLADPGLRSKVPSSLLPYKYQKQRFENQKKKNFLNPSWVTQQQTPAQVDSEARAAGQLKYGPIEQQLESELAASPQQIKNIENYNKDYQAHNSEMSQRLADIDRQIQGQVSLAKTSDQSRDEATRKEIQAQQDQEASVRGAVKDSSVTALAAQAAAGRQNMLDTFGTHQGLQNFSAQTLLAGRAGAQKRQEGDDKEKEVGYRRKLIGDLASARSDRGAYMADFARQARDGEREYELSNKAFGLNSAKARSDNAVDLARLTQDKEESKFNKWLKQKQLEIDGGRLQETSRHNQAMENKRTGSSGSSPKDRRKIRQDAIKYRSTISRAAGDIPVILQNAKKEGTPISSTELRAVLSKQYKDSNVVNAAMDLHYRGGLSPANRRILETQGYGVPKKWKSKYKPAKKLKAKAGGELYLG